MCIISFKTAWNDTSNNTCLFLLILWKHYNSEEQQKHWIFFIQLNLAKEFVIWYKLSS